MAEKKPEDTCRKSPPNSTCEKSQNSKDENASTDVSSENFLKQEQQLMSKLLKRPVLPNYTVMSFAGLRKEPLATDITWEDGTGPMLGFSELRKYKKVNERRIITPYRREKLKLSSSRSSEVATPEIKIDDPKRFFLEKNGSLPITDLKSLLQMVRNYPDIGFVTMNREHMDLVNDYNPYSFTICNYNNIDKLNYATASPKGIVEFYEEDADFLPLSRLQLEQELFTALKKIPSFHSFRLWKAFMVWFKKARTKRFIEAKIKMEIFFAAKYGSKAKPS